MKINSLQALAMACAIASYICAAGRAADQPAKGDQSADAGDHAIALADGKLELTTPEAWIRKEPRTSIVEHEFEVPAAKGDSTSGRMTVMSAGGSVEANIDRWKGQFKDGDKAKNPSQVTKKQIAGAEVHLVDLSGTFKDQRGPFAPAVERPNYRMLAAIIAKDGSNYFIKFYGPERTVSENAEPFRRMIDGLKQK